MRLQRISRRTLADAVFDQLSGEILEGRMKPGVALPPERELTAALGVNRQAVREALQRLAQAGLVAIQHGGGTRVLDFRRNAGLELLTTLLLRPDGGIDLHVARSVMEMRAVLAPEIARCCAARGGDEAAAKLQAVLARMTQSDSLAQSQTLALEFWDVLVRGSDNIAYELAFNALRATYERIRGALVRILADEVRDVAGYRAIATAVAAGDERKAARAAERLVQQGTQRLLLLLVALERSDAASGGDGGGGIDDDNEEHDED